MNMKIVKKLKILYEKGSKHSNYQILPKRLASIIGNDIRVKSRYEYERLNFVLKYVDVKNKKILDIGGNTGFFTFELIEKGAKRVDYYEGNKEHAEFVKLASAMLGLSDRIYINNKYLSFKNELDGRFYDVTFLLNVLHHIGDDFDDKKITIDQAKRKIITYLNYLADKTTFLVFQIGFNWKGNIYLPLFDSGSKKELIDFITSNLEKKYKIEKIGIPEKTNEGIVYNEMNKVNIKRDDSLGEFLNRPIFIMKSKKGI